MRAVRRIAGSLLLVGTCALGCSETESSIDAVATDLAAPATEHEISQDTAMEPAGSVEDPLEVFGLSAPTDAAATIVTPVWLINRSRDALIVSAAGGAATVIVDTVSASDSVLVRIATPADSVVLSARTIRGIFMGRVGLLMDAEKKRAAFPQ